MSRFVDHPAHLAAHAERARLARVLAAHRAPQRHPPHTVRRLERVADCLPAARGCHRLHVVQTALSLDRHVPHNHSGPERRRCPRAIHAAALAPAGQLRRLLLESAGRHRHRPGADGAAVRRSHGASRPRHLRYGRADQRQDLRPRSAPRSLSAVGRTVEAAGLAVTCGDARHHREDNGRERKARRRNPVLVVVRTGQPRADSRRPAPTRGSSSWCSRASCIRSDG